MAVGGEADYGGDKNGRERGEDGVALFFRQEQCDSLG
jgi:hypothetical protein